MRAPSGNSHEKQGRRESRDSLDLGGTVSGGGTPMVDSVVQTKLFLPRLRRELVARPRLNDELERGQDAALVLVSGPAGFGKTTLLASALAARSPTDQAGRAVAWVSLDARDGEASRFWTYVLTALETASPGCAGAALAELEAGGGHLEDVVAALVNELSVRADNVTLVLDDYHLADTPEVGSTVSFLLDHQPPQLHLVISTRMDPALPLSRLRARGELVEIRAADLRFTAEEAATYLNRVQQLGLSPSDVEALESRTEGWVAALQLAALSLHHRDDAGSFIASFTGDDRFVMDYLVDEVLDQQPASVRRFLLDTSILDRLSGPLCDAITGGDDGRAVLETLERRNLLVVPLDNRRHWYRYHHLFAEALQSRLLAERPEDVAVLNRRASDWHQEAGDVEAAVRHAFAAGDVDRAADLIELAAPLLRRRRAEGTLRAWITQVPADVLERRPVLASSFIAALMASNVFDGLGDKLDALESALSGSHETLIVRDRAEWERLPALLATHRAGLALVAGDLDATITHADAALAKAAAQDRLTVVAAAALKGLASWSAGDLVSAHASYVTATEGLVAAGHISDVLACTVTLVELELQQGQLSTAHQAARRALDLAAAAAGEGVARGTADMWVALSRVAWQRGDVAATEEFLHRAADLGEAAGLPQQPYRWRVAMAELRQAQGDPDAADGLLAEAESLFNSDFSPNVRPVPAVRARLHLRTGNLTAAHTWAVTAGVRAGDELTYLREFEHLTLARLLLAEHAHTGDQTRLFEALTLLGRLHEAAAAGARTAAFLETCILQALACDAAGDAGEAREWLQQAVSVARPRAWLRPFLDEGARLGELLPLLPPAAADFVRAVTAAAAPSARPSGDDAAPRPLVGTAGSRPAGGTASMALVVPLSSRELDVLRLLASDLDGPAIARHLNVSLATVRTHTQHIYAKLGVNSRRAAVRRGHQLNL
jgi:LuxR family maltose regulon positive regulatory protein